MPRTDPSRRPDSSVPDPETALRAAAEAAASTAAGEQRGSVHVASEQPIVLVFAEPPAAEDRPAPISSLPTSIAVADAVEHYRVVRELTRDELSFVLGRLGHALSAQEIAQIEGRMREVSVDDLVALSYALDVTPVRMLTHVPLDMPDGDESLATGVPADVPHQELVAWMEGRTRLDLPERLAFWKDQHERLEIRLSHLEGQRDAAEKDLNDRGFLISQAERSRDLDAQSLVQRIYVLTHDVDLTALALAAAEKRIEELQG